MYKLIIIPSILILFAALLSACNIQNGSTAIPSPTESSPTIFAPEETAIEQETQSPDLTEMDDIGMKFPQTRDIAMDFIIREYALPPAAEWTEEALPGSAIRYISGPWVVVVSADETTLNRFAIIADHMSEAVRWEGAVNADGSVSETLFTRAGQDVQTGGSQNLQQWTGSISSLPAGAQYDDVFTSSKDQATFGIDGASPEMNELIAQYRDSNTLVTIEGYLSLNVPDVNSCQIRVTKLIPSGFLN